MATIIGTSAADTITPALVSPGVTGGTPGDAADRIEPGAGRNLIDAAGGDDRIVSIGVDTVEGGAGFDVWEVDYRGLAGLGVTQTGARSFAISNGAVATGIEGYAIRLGADAVVSLLPRDIPGDAASITVGSGHLLLDWSAKVGNVYVAGNLGFANGNLGSPAPAEIVRFAGFTSAEIRGGSGDDLLIGLARGGRSTILGGAGDDLIDGFGINLVRGGGGTDFWSTRNAEEDGLTFRQTGATSFTLSNGTVAQGVEVYSAMLGENATVFLRSGGVDGRYNSVIVRSGHLDLDWSDKTTGSYVQVTLGNGYNDSFGDRSGDGSGDERLSTLGFTSAAVRTGSGDDVVYGTGGADLIRTGAGADELIGLGGADTLRGGPGDDVYFVDDPLDRIVEAAGEGTDSVVADVTWRLAANLETLFLTGLLDIDGTGNAAGNSLVGNAGANRLSGLQGDDSLYGEAGADRLLGGSGADQLAGGDGADTLDGGAGDDILVGGAAGDRLIGGTGRDVIRYAAIAEGADTIIGFVSAEDVIEVSAAGFGGGLVAGAAASLVANLAEATGSGQFIWEAGARRLWWDADGLGGAQAALLGVFVGTDAPVAADIVVVA